MFWKSGRRRPSQGIQVDASAEHTVGDQELPRCARIAARTISLKTTNEDCCDLYVGNSVSAIAIADGLGTSADSDVAARLCVSAFLQQVREADLKGQEISMTDLPMFWRKTAMALKTYYAANVFRYQDKQNPLETTLITLVDCPESYLISYLGNGSVWYIRGDSFDFLDRRWPWSISDIMVGHTILDETGKDALYGVIGPYEMTIDPRILVLTKDKRFGEIFLLTTDGISSQDHLKVGRDPSEKLWIEVNPHIHRLLTCYLPKYLLTVTNEREGNGLDETLNRFLRESVFDDDATIAVVVSDVVFNYYASKGRESASGVKDQH